MNKSTNLTPPVKNEETEMPSELAAVTATALRAMSLKPLDDSDSMDASIAQTTRLLLVIDIERPELGIRATIADLVRRHQSGQSVNPAATLLELMERAGLRQPAASA